MLILLRIIFTGAFLYAINEARLNAQTNPQSGDLTQAFWLGVTVVIAIATAATWAPYFGEKVSDPLTGGMVSSSYKEHANRLLQFIHWCEKKGWRGLAAWLCFIEGVRFPWLPTPFVVGLHNAREGSWLEKVYAREVFKFNNAEHCMKAFRALQRHGIDPRPHQSADVNIVLLSLDKEVRPEAQILNVPEAPPPPKLERDPRIKLG